MGLIGSFGRCIYEFYRATYSSEFRAYVLARTALEPAKSSPADHRCAVFKEGYMAFNDSCWEGA